MHRLGGARANDKDTKSIISNRWPFTHDPSPASWDLDLRPGDVPPSWNREQQRLSKVWMPACLFCLCISLLFSHSHFLLLHKMQPPKWVKFVIPGGLGPQLFGNVVPESLVGLSKAALLMQLHLNP